MSVDTECLTESEAGRTDSATVEETLSAREGIGGSSVARWRRVVAFGVLPGLALALAVTAGYLKWLDSSAREITTARIESVRIATESAVAMLSYQPDTVEQTLNTARNRLTGKLKESYTTLTRDVVIPGSRQRHIAATAAVPAATALTASGTHAVVLLFVDQTIMMGNDPPTSTASRVRVTLDNINGLWLVVGFDPI